MSDWAPSKSRLNRGTYRCAVFDVGNGSTLAIEANRYEELWLLEAMTIKGNSYTCLKEEAYPSRDELLAAFDRTIANPAMVLASHR